MAKINNYKDLKVWQKAIKLTNWIYDITLAFPDYEKFGLANQLRRASVAIPSNLAEDSVRPQKDFARFITMARGSLAEVETQMIIAEMRGFISSEDNKILATEMVEISKMLMGLLRSIQQSTPKNQAPSTKH